MVTTAVENCCEYQEVKQQVSGKPVTGISTSWLLIPPEPLWSLPPENDAKTQNSEQIKVISPLNYTLYYLS